MSIFASTSTSTTMVITPPSSSSSRHVGFSPSCTIIPESITGIRRRRTRRTLTIKSYTLPLYSPTQEEKKELVLKLPLPQFKKSCPSPVICPAPPCLVNNARHRPPPLTLTIDSSSSAYRTLPSPVSPTTPGPSSALECEKIPLRECCSKCYSATEECRAKGDQWVVAFSKGAIRRRRGLDGAVALKEVDEVEGKTRRGGSCDLARSSVPKVEEVVEEEDLFPLPRRSPSSSPASVSPASSQIGFDPSAPEPVDGILGSSLKRKDRCPAGYLCPENASTSTLPSPPNSPKLNPTTVFEDDENLPPPITFSSHVYLSSPTISSRDTRSVSDPSAHSASPSISPAQPNISSSISRASTFPASPKSNPTSPSILPPTPQSQARPVPPSRRRSSILSAGKHAFAGAAAGMMKGFSGVSGSI